MDGSRRRKGIKTEGEEGGGGGRKRMNRWGKKGDEKKKIKKGKIQRKRRSGQILCRVQGVGDGVI